MNLKSKLLFMILLQVTIAMNTCLYLLLVMVIISPLIKPHSTLKSDPELERNFREMMKTLLMRLLLVFPQVPRCNGFLPSLLLRSEVLVQLNLLLAEDSEKLDGKFDYQHTKDILYVKAQTFCFNMNLHQVASLHPEI